MLENFLGFFTNPSNEYVTIIKIITSFSFVYAILQCFFGLKLFKVIIGIMGAIIGFMFGIKLGYIININFLCYVFSVIFAVGGCYFSVKFYKIGVFVYGFGIGTLLGFVFTGLNVGFFIYALVLGLIVGVLSVVFFKPMLITTSAISGGILISGTILSLFTPTPYFILKVILSLVFIILGMLVQYKMDKTNIKKQK